MEQKIEPTNGCLYIHIPRTAGTSLRKTTGCWNAHYAARWVRDILPDWKSLWTFAIIRNPWDQALSWWMLCTRSKIFSKPFRRWVVDNDSGWADRMKLWKNLDPIDQWFYITDEAGNIIVKYVARFENLDKEWNLISKKMGFSGVSLEHASSTKHARYREYYDIRTADVIYNRYQELIDEFGYDF